MKRHLAIIISMIYTLFNFLTPVYAATESNGSIIYTDEGNSVFYDDDEVNGGVDLQTQLLIPENELVDKSISSYARSNPSSVVISIPFETQQNDYYCGPASAKMVLGGLGYTVTQSYMAGLLGTNSTIGTYAGNGVANALNTVVAGSSYQFNGNGILIQIYQL